MPITHVSTHTHIKLLQLKYLTTCYGVGFPPDGELCQPPRGNPHPGNRTPPPPIYVCTIFPHFLWYLHQGWSVKSMNRTVAFDYKPWKCLGEKLHFWSYNVLHIHLISLWFPSICHSSKGPRTLYCRLSIVANHLREVPKGSHR